MPNLYDSIYAVGDTPTWTALPKARITSDLYLYVSTTGSDATGDGTSGNPVATVNGALALIKDAVISNTAFVKIYIQDGQYSNWPTQYLNHPCGDRIIVQAQNFYSKSINGTVTRSGSAGSWSATIPCTDTSNVVANDYIMIIGGTGGTEWYGLLGVHLVTSVSTNVSITVAVKNYPCPNSANFTGTLYIFKSVIAFNSSISGFAYTLGTPVYYTYGLALVGQASTASYGFFSNSNHDCNLGACAAINWNNGFGTNHGALIASSCASAQCTVGGLVQWGHAYFSSCVLNGLTNGCLSGYGSTIYGPSTHSIQEGSSKAGVGQTAAYGSTHTSQTSFTSSWSIGYYANIESCKVNYTSTDTGSTTAASPTVNTEGNGNSYILSS